MTKFDLVCIIDDDPIIVFGTKKLMELANFCGNFMVFENGKLALEGLKPLIQNQDLLPEIILLDINMPVMDGWEFLEEITKIEPLKTITIYMVSSSIDPADIKRAESYSIVDKYIVKPINLEGIKKMMSDTCWALVYSLKFRIIPLRQD